jgi:hypothetical protein
LQLGLPFVLPCGTEDVRLLRKSALSDKLLALQILDTGLQFCDLSFVYL